MLNNKKNLIYFKMGHCEIFYGSNPEKVIHHIPCIACGEGKGSLYVLLNRKGKVS